MYMIVYVLGDGIDVCKHDGALKTSTRQRVAGQMPAWNNRSRSTEVKSQQQTNGDVMGPIFTQKTILGDLQTRAIN
jgi:hypothetical protein